MSLIHEKVTAVPDNPAYDVGSDEWNAEHKFPGAGAGEVVFVDGSGHAATDASFTFDSGPKTLSVLGLIADTLTSQDFVDLVLTSYSSSDTSVSALTLGNQGTFLLDATDPSANSGTVSFDGSVVKSATGSAELQVWNANGSFPDSVVAIKSVLGLIPTTNNNRNLGGLAADLGADKLWAIGYFGTSVSAPLFTAAGVGDGITNTITTASLVGKTITITGGIITGFA